MTDRVFAVRDTTTSDTAVQPTTPLRSGGPGSLVAWDTLGYQGRNFAGQGPTAGRDRRVHRHAAPEPIRAYAGIDSAGNVEDRAAPGGRRPANGPAGSTAATCWSPGPPAPVGSTRPRSTSFEYETGGDAAAVAIQYSYLPSWASFLVDQEKAREAGRAMFDAVYQKWSALPAGQRPKLYAFGLSLGSFAAEAPFSGEADMANRTDGILLAGPPAFNPLNREFTDGRDPGSPEVQPVFRDGRTVRFANDPATGIPPDGQRLGRDPGAVPAARVRPDRLAEPGSDPAPTGLARRTAGQRRDQRDGLDPVRHLLAGHHGHARTGRHPTRARAHLHPGIRRRLGHILQPPGWTTAAGRRAPHPDRRAAAIIREAGACGDSKLGNYGGPGRSRTRREPPFGTGGTALKQPATQERGSPVPS